MKRLTIVAFSVLFCFPMFVKLTDANIDPETAVGVWLFNKTGGDIVKDSSQHGNDGVFEGEPEWVSDGKFGHALKLDGVDDYVIVPDHESLDTNLNEVLTIVVWAKGSFRPSDWHGIVTKAQGWEVDMCYLLQRNANGVFEFAPFSQKFDQVWVASDIKPADDTWYHVAGVYDGKNGLIYVDGQLRASQAYSLGIADTDAPVIIGSNYPSAIQCFKGTIDEVAIFSVALSEEDINIIMTEGLEEATGIRTVELLGKLTISWGQIKSHQ